MDSVSIEQLRALGPGGVASALSALAPSGILIANASSESDIECVALGALEAELAGVPVIARTAASYVRARAGQNQSRLLTGSEMPTKGRGIVVVGSYVDTTSRQLSELLANDDLNVVPIELGVAAFAMDEDTSGAETAAVDVIDKELRKGHVPVVFTSRGVVSSHVGRDYDAARRISSGLVRIVSAVRERPDWIVAKGGITSSDLASRALNVDSARVLGQVVPGVPVWRCGARSRWPGLTFIVFPGNVGGPDALRQLVRGLVG